MVTFAFLRKFFAFSATCTRNFSILRPFSICAFTVSNVAFSDAFVSCLCISGGIFSVGSAFKAQPCFKGGDFRLYEPCVRSAAFNYPA